MPYSVNTSLDRYENAAKHFLQSVVVIDDQAEVYEGELINELKVDTDHTSSKKKLLSRRPATGLSHKQSSRAIRPKSGTPSKTPKENTNANPHLDMTHILRAWILTEKFADEEILCTVYRPADRKIVSKSGNETKNEKNCTVVSLSAKMARPADIVVLDWELGGGRDGDKGTQKAREIIKTILNDDQIKKGRQRLIVIYTALANLEGIYDDVVADVGEVNYIAGKFKQDKLGLSLSNKTTRIVFLNKSTKFTEPNSEATVSEKNLPARLIKEFVKLNRGLLPSIALHSIASIRDTTHHLLSTFSSDLDPALVSHRCLLPNPKDSEEFVLDLVAGELRSILSLNQIGQHHADVKAHKDWIADQLEDQEAFQLKKHISVSRKEAFDLVTKGDDAFKKVRKSIANRWVDDAWKQGKEFKHKKIPRKLSKRTLKKLVDTENLEDLHKNIKAPLLNFDDLTAVFSKSPSMGNLINHDFSRLTTLKREQYGARNLPEGWAPKLGQGSIIRKINDDGTYSKNFLLCIQPRCDSVRIKESRTFPFLTMASVGISARPRQCLIVKSRVAPNEDPKNIRLLLYPLPYCQTMLKFEPAAAASDCIEAVRENEVWVFKNSEQCFEWVADMKDFLAQKLCDLLSGRQGSIGLEEYEWLRRKSK